MTNKLQTFPSSISSQSKQAGLLAQVQHFITPSQLFTSGIRYETPLYSGGSAKAFHFIPYSPVMGT